MDRKLHRLKVIGLSLWVCAVAIQSLWWFQAQDVIPVVLVIVGGVIGTSVFLGPNILARFPISASMMLGYTVYQFLLPPIATILDGKPLTNNLNQPFLVFFHAFLCLLFLMVAHLIYRNWHLLQGLRWFVAERIYRPFGFFHAPSNPHLLAMGCIGLIATYLQIFVAGGVQNELLGAGDKFMQALFILVYLPFVMLVRGTMGSKIRISQRWLFVLAGYTVILLILAIARNSRTVLLLGLASVVLVYFYGLIVGLYRTRVISVKTLLLALVGAAIVLGPVADIATSMVIARNERSEMSSGELVQRTLEVFSDKEAIRDRRLASLDDNPIWDERYVDNQFLSRLANPKFADNSIDLALAMSDSDRGYFRSLEFARSLSIFPRPILQGLGLPVDKDFVTSSSSGDLMLYTVTGNSYVLGDFRASSMFGSGYAMFGWGYPFVLATIALLLFAMADSLTSRREVSRSGQNSTAWLPILSPMAIIGFFTWFSYFTSAARGLESLLALTNYLFRGWLEGFLVYALAFWVAYFVIKPFSNGVRLNAKSF